MSEAARPRRAPFGWKTVAFTLLALCLVMLPRACHQGDAGITISVVGDDFAGTSVLVDGEERCSLDSGIAYFAVFSGRHRISLVTKSGNRWNDVTCDVVPGQVIRVTAVK